MEKNFKKMYTYTPGRKKLIFNETLYYSVFKTFKFH